MYVHFKCATYPFCLKFFNCDMKTNCFGEVITETHNPLIIYSLFVHRKIVFIFLVLWKRVKALQLIILFKHLDKLKIVQNLHYGFLVELFKF